MQKYRIVKTLGEGAYGTVFKAQLRDSGELVAIKKMKQKFNDWQDCVNLREIKSLQKLKHPNIIKLRQMVKQNDQLFLVFEFLQTNIYELYSAIKKKKKLGEAIIRSIVFQCASALAYMHKSGYFHRDLKPQNILISNDLVKIIDFGLAREIRSRPPYTDYVSTRWYRAPQLVLRSDNYNCPVDIFALGCIMAELYMMEPLFPGTQTDQMSKVIKILGCPSKQDWPEGYKLASKQGFYFQDSAKVDLKSIVVDASDDAINLIELMLQFNPRKRPTASDLLKHPYFTGLSLDKLQLKLPQEIIKQTDGDRIKRKQKRQLDMRETRKQKFLESKRTRDGWLKRQEKQKEEDVDDIIKEIKAKKKQKVYDPQKEKEKERQKERQRELEREREREREREKEREREREREREKQRERERERQRQSQRAASKDRDQFNPARKNQFMPPSFLNPKFDPYRKSGMGQNMNSLAFPDRETRAKHNFNYNPITEPPSKKGGSLEYRGAGLAAVGMNILKPTLLRQKEYQLPSNLGYKFNPYQKL